MEMKVDAKWLARKVEADPELNSEAGAPKRFDLVASLREHGGAEAERNKSSMNAYLMVAGANEIDRLQSAIRGILHHAAAVSDGSFYIRDTDASRIALRTLLATVTQ